MAHQVVRPGQPLDFVTPHELREAIGVGDIGREQGYSSLYDVVAGDFDHPEPVVLTSPPARRLRITRHGRGGDSLVIPSALSATSTICTANEGRMGLQIVNYGANNLFVYLAAYDDLMAAGGGETVPSLWLKSGGGSWDGEFAECLWGGNVTVRADAGTTTITLVEI